MTKQFSTDEVVTQGDEYLRAKAGELDNDSDSPPREPAATAAGKPAQPAAKPAEAPPPRKPGSTS